MIRFAVIAGIVLGAGAAAVQLIPVPRAAVRAESERSLPATAFAAPLAAPNPPLDINPPTTRMFRTPWNEFVAVDSRAPHVPLVQAHGWTIFADGSVSRINGDAVPNGNPLIPIQ